jgi:hypothetical protein
MHYTYRPRAMPSRFLEGAPPQVKRDVLDIIEVKPAAPLEYDVIFRQMLPGNRGGQLYGLDFGADGAQGCHFYLDTFDMRAYRERNRRMRVAWRDLPPDTQNAILRYVNELA